MFRPTQFVILFAVVLCATAFPADPAPGEPGKGPVTGLTAPKQPISNPAGETGPAKGDLDTDATVHFGYYYGPRWGYYGPGWGARAYGWGPYGWY